MTGSYTRIIKRRAGVICGGRIKLFKCIRRKLLTLHIVTRCSGTLVACTQGNIKRVIGTKNMLITKVVVGIKV
jgi:hypothetical protein